MECGKERLHFLDWLRAVLVCFVVFAHLVFCGAQIGRPEDTGAPDDHAYSVEPANLLAARWIAVARQWCIPLLFWVSGAAHALSFTPASLARQMRKVGLLTLLGVAPNAVAWLAGPRDELCSFRRPCPGKGWIFDFTEDPYSGNVEPYINQMWYTVMLLILMPMNAPLFKAMAGEVQPWKLSLQLVAYMVTYAVLIFTAGAGCPAPVRVWVLLLCGEVVLFTLAVLGTPSGRLPLRVVHYLWAALASMEMGLLPLARTPVVDDVSAEYALYLLIGTSRWFQLGFLMTRARLSTGGGPCEPVALASRAWPVTSVLLVLFCPSTSWSMAGMLPYPLLPRALDRLLYVSGTFLAFFVVDRCSRHLACGPLPTLLADACLALYLLQVVLITVFLQLLSPWIHHQLGPQPGPDDSGWLLGLLMALLLASSLVVAVLAGSLRRRSGGTYWGSLAAEEMQPRGPDARGADMAD